MDPTSRRLVIRIAAWTAGLIVIMGIYYAFMVNKGPAEPSANEVDARVPAAEKTEKATDAPQASDEIPADRNADGTEIGDEAEDNTADEATEPSIDFDQNENSATAIEN